MLSEEAKQALSARMEFRSTLETGLTPPGLIASASAVLALSNADHREDDLVTDQLRASTPSDLHKQAGIDSNKEPRAREYTRFEPTWSQRMINENMSLRDLLIDNKVSDSEFAKAAAASLQVQFPDHNLNNTVIIAKKVKEQYIENWRLAVLGISVYYRHFHKFPSPVEVRDYLQGSGNGTLDVDNITNYLSDPNTDKALSNLGITMPNAGLSEKQLLALSIVSSFTDTRPLPAKLKAQGIMHWEFTNWLGYPKFQAAYRRITEDLLNEVQPVINTALVQLATGQTKAQDGRPDLAAIKYLNEVNGRWDPSSRQTLDVRIVITRIIEILTSEITDPDLLRRIGGKLALMTGSLGLNNNTSQIEIEGTVSSQ